MIRGEKIGLRAQQASDGPVLHAELYDDVATYARADGRPWRPMAAEAEESPYAVRPPTDGVAFFSVVELASDELAGAALLWNIDAHNRSAHLGISLRPAYRGRGLGGDVVRVLCEYGFAVRGMHRLQLETATDNHAMRAAAVRAGFTMEGTLRSSSWGYGHFLDEVVYGLLKDEWTP